MAVNFPDSPSNGDTHVVGGVTYAYNSTKNAWETIGGAIPNLSVVAEDILPDADSSRDLGSPTKKWKSLYLSSDTLFLGDSGSISAGPGGEIILPSIKIGKGDNAVKLEADGSGKLKTKKVVGGVTQAAEEPGNAITVANMAGLIALTGMSTGQIALVSALNRVFMYTGTGWFKIADMTNATPTDITGVDASYALAIDGTPTTITAVSTDPEGFPLTWSYAVTAGSLGSTATVAQADNVFTITPSTTEAHAGTFSITFSVTDGATGAVSVVSAFTLAFGDDPGRASFYKGSPTYSNGWISSYNWTVPAGVTSICVLCIGAGGGGGGSNDTSRGGGGGGLAWKNHIPVTAGEIWKVNVGTAGWKDGGQSGDAYPLNATHTYFSTSSNIVILRANGGSTNSTATDNPGGYGYNRTSSTYGTGTAAVNSGGSGARSANGKWGGGGGAAGYSGAGGRGGYGTGSYANGVAGSGGGGGGSGSGSAAVGGGGVGIYGEGSSGAAGTASSSGWPHSGQGGSGGENSQGAGNGEGGNYGGGGGYYGKGGDATVQIIWGRGRSYPNTLTTLSDDT